MLVAALMDIITSNCDNAEYSSFHPLLPADADIRDIAAAIEVIEEGGMHFDDHEDDSSDDGDSGLKGIGIKVLGGTTILGFSRENNSLKIGNSGDDILEVAQNSRMEVARDSSELVNQEPTIDYVDNERLSSHATPGLWDDLQREHVAVPFATWALANWAIASDRSKRSRKSSPSAPCSQTPSWTHQPGQPWRTCQAARSARRHCPRAHPAGPCRAPPSPAEGSRRPRTP